MNTEITFELATQTEIRIMRNGKQIGQIWSENKDTSLPYPHGYTDICKNSIQVCGFDTCSEIWGCGVFEGKKDLVVHFLPISSSEYQQEEYLKYLKDKMAKKEFGTIQNFADFQCYNIGQWR